MPRANYLKKKVEKGQQRMSSFFGSKQAVNLDVFDGSSFFFFFFFDGGGGVSGFFGFFFYITPPLHHSITPIAG